MPEQFTAAERELHKAFGKQVTFTSYSGQVSQFKALERIKQGTQDGKGFQQRTAGVVLDVILADFPTDWRDGQITIGNRRLNVLDMIPDASGELAEVWCE